jgi:hypothetical protein
MVCVHLVDNQGHTHTHTHTHICVIHVHSLSCTILHIIQVLELVQGTTKKLCVYQYCRSLQSRYPATIAHNLPYCLCAAGLEAWKYSQVRYCVRLHHPHFIHRYLVSWWSIVVEFEQIAHPCIVNMRTFVHRYCMCVLCMSVLSHSHVRVAWTATRLQVTLLG